MQLCGRIQSVLRFSPSLLQPKAMDAWIKPRIKKMKRDENIDAINPRTKKKMARLLFLRKVFSCIVVTITRDETVTKVSQFSRVTMEDNGVT